jgi:hypothetical protein
MSYIPKYILKRMIPADAVKAIDGGLQFNMVNVISPLSVEGIPESGIEQYVEFWIDGNKISDEQKLNTTLTIGEESARQTYTLKEARKFDSVVVPVGGKMTIFFPGVNVKPGEEHEFELLVKTEHPFNLKVSRTVV